MKTIIVDDIEVMIETKKMKHMYIRILPPNGAVKVTAPIRMPEEKIIEFVRSKRSWIFEHQQIVQQRELERPNAFQYESEEIHYVWGKPYPLKVISRGTASRVWIQDSYLVLQIPKGSTSEQR